MNYKEELREAVLKEDFSRTYDVLNELVKENIGEEYLEYLIKLIANNPLVDFGMPGPIVHFIESFPEYKYEMYLKTELKDRPNSLLLWMLNRIVNTPACKNGKEYLLLFHEISERNDIDIAVRTEAKEYLEYQEGCRGTEE